MSVSIDKARRVFQDLESKGIMGKMFSSLSEDHSTNNVKLPKNEYTSKVLQERINTLRNDSTSKLNWSTKLNEEVNLANLQGNIENFIGFSCVPTGVVGPVRVNGSCAKGDFWVPLATTEGALVASYHRGAKATLLSGGITSACLTEGVKRSPLFGFESMEKALRFLVWITGQKEHFTQIVTRCTSHGKLNDIQLNVEGNQTILTFEFLTGDAAGQNMVTICTEAICQYIVSHSPIAPKYWYVEGNYSGDKKASAHSFSSVRGKKVSAECVLPAHVLTEVLKTKAGSVAQYWRASTVSVIQTGSIGAQGHFANGLTALFLATGQDVACVSEASVGVTRMEVVDEKDLYVSVTLPNLIVGTVGGGTNLPTQKEYLELMGCYGTGQAKKYAEICAALLLCGEISIASALAEGHFTQAHQNLGR